MGPVRCAPAPFLLVLALAACGGGSKGTAGGTLPSCAHPGPAIALPQRLDRFPLPHGAVIDSSRMDAAGDPVFAGYVPGDLEPARDYFERELPKRGYDLGEGDAEEQEAETDFEGHGIDGHLKLHDLSGCDGAVTLEIGLR